jgi:hypothetical protein
VCKECKGKGVIHASTNSLILFQPCPCNNPMKANERLERWYKKFMEETADGGEIAGKKNCGFRENAHSV